ncbi:unnamed protein product [Lymnaea stagnalis]|uniref:N-acetyltransferase domain-containing protein n=1 Tax=Lymnaea stagnalis TaxID=6523 RepID=A0AAV2HLK6_LYMST
MSRSTLLRHLCHARAVRVNHRQPPGSLSRLYCSEVTTPPGLIREAHREDYTSVMQISSDVYGGRDFLPCMYPVLVRSPDIHSYVFEMSGEVVAFEAAHVVDDGITIVARGSRVKQNYHGLGILKSLRNHIVDRLVARHASKFIAMITSSTAELAKDSPSLIPNEVILKRNVHVFPYQTSNLDIPERDDFSATTVTELTVGQLCDVFVRPAFSQYLFPYERIIINAVPFRLMTANSELIQSENPFILMSDKVRVGRNPPNQGLVSMTTWYSCKAGICVDLEFYGRSSNFPEICNHVRRHLQHVHHLAPHGHIMVPHSYTISTDALLCAFSRHGLAPMDSPFKTQYLLEGRIDTA